jgi:hypothetical protein
MIDIVVDFSSCSRETNNPQLWGPSQQRSLPEKLPILCMGVSFMDEKPSKTIVGAALPPLKAEKNLHPSNICNAVQPSTKAQTSIQSFFPRRRQCRSQDTVYSNMKFFDKNASTNNNKNDKHKASVGHNDQPRKHQYAPSYSKKPKRKQQQLYLDFGQRDFAAKLICSVCGMMFVHGEKEDIQIHDKICKDYREGVTLQNFKSISKFLLPQQQLYAHIVEVRPTDSVWLRKKVAQVQRIVDQELGFFHKTTTDSVETNRHTAFLCILEKRIVGFVLAEIIEQAYELLDSSHSSTSALERSKRPTKAVLGIYQLWVHVHHRQNRIASALVDAARHRMVFGYTIPRNATAFSSPTLDGVRFARRYSCENDNDDPSVLVYDCC